MCIRDRYKISQYDEEEFKNWVGTILPNYGGDIEDTGVGEAMFVDIPGDEKLYVDLQPGETGFERLFLSDPNKTKNQIQSIINLAKERKSNPDPYVVFNEFSQQGQNVDMLNEQYNKIGLYVEQDKRGGVNISKDGDIITKEEWDANGLSLIHI